MRLEMPGGMTVEHRDDSGQFIVSWPGGFHRFAATDVDTALACIALGQNDLNLDIHREQFERGKAIGYEQGQRAAWRARYDREATQEAS